MGKVLVTSSHFEELCQPAWRLLREAGHEVVLYRGELPYMSFEEIAAVIGGIDAAIVGLDRWTEDVWKIAPRLKAVAKFGVGTDNIDVESARRYGVKVLNAPGINANAVAELTVGLMLDMLRGVTEQHNLVAAGTWPRFMGGELAGKTVGLMGFGAVAKAVARMLRGFETHTIACDLYPDRRAAEELGVELVASEEVVGRSDILSIHVPCTPETTHLFDDALFARMKRGAYLVNAARGAIVDTAALLRALDSGQLEKAALDAFETEPLSPDDPLIRSGRVLCTPHTGAETRETYEKVSLCVAQGIIDVLAGREPRYWVNR